MSDDYNVNNKKHSEVLRRQQHQHQRDLDSMNTRHNNEVNRKKANHAAQKQILRHNSDAAINHLRLGHKSEEMNAKVNQHNKMSQAQIQNDKKYQQLVLTRQRQRQQLEHSAHTEKRSFTNQKNQNQRMREVEKSKGELELDQTRNEHRHRMKQERETQRVQQEKVHKEHNSKLDNLINTKETIIKENRRKYDGKLENQKEFYDAKLDRDQTRYDYNTDRHRELYEDRIEREETFFENQLSQQNSEFKDTFMKNELANKDTLLNQKQRYEAELFKIRKEFAHKLDFYKERKEDPFYRVLDMGAKMQEGETWYEVQAQVPKHEIRNVRVTVQPEGLAITGARRHEENIKNPSGEKIKTHNVQTVRQSFDFNQPADHKNFVRNYNEETGMLTITVPKKGFKLNPPPGTNNMV